MSAFIVTDNCLNDVVTLTLRAAGEIAKGNEKKCNSLKATLLRINEESVNYRYGENTFTKSSPFKETTVSIKQLAKSYRCWSYQSCEHESQEFNLLDEDLDNTCKHLLGEEYHLILSEVEWDRQ